MIISVINRSRAVADDELQSVIRAVNRQIAEDFAPYWSFGATLRLEGPTRRRPPGRMPASDMRGDAVLYLVDQSLPDDLEGYHLRSFDDLPYGIVGRDVSATLQEQWSVTFSHEALELVADPMANLMVHGPDPHDRRRKVFHVFEVCDAVQDESYTVDGVAVSNFVLPSYFTPGEVAGRRNDFLGRAHGGRTLQSFDLNPGGYLAYYDPRRPDKPWQLWFGETDDPRAQARAETKQAARTGRTWRRSRETDGPPERPAAATVVDGPATGSGGVRRPMAR